MLYFPLLSVSFRFLSRGCVSGSAYELRHGSHGAVHAPGAGLEEDHGKQPQHGGGEHHAVEAKGKLRDAVRKEGAMVGPAPWELKCPQQCNHRVQASGAGEDEPCVPQHEEEHDKEEG